MKNIRTETIELKKKDSDEVSTIERRKFIGMGITAAVFLAGDALFYICSYIDRIFSSIKDSKEGF